MIFKTFLSKKETKNIQEARDCFKSMNLKDKEYGCLTNINIATGNIDVMFLKPEKFIKIQKFVRQQRIKFL